MKSSIIGVLALLALAFSSCTDFQEEDAPVGLSVNRKELSFSQNGESQSVTVSSGTKWDVTSMPSWISLSSISRSGVSPYEWSVDFYSASNEEYNRDGKIVFKSQNGSVEVSVSQEGKNGGFVAVESVTLSKTELTLTVGESVVLTYGIIPSEASIKDVSWESGSTAIATVTQSGQIDAISEGNAIITVKTKDGGKTASCSVTVKPVAVSSVTLDKESLSLKIGETYSLIATVLPESAANKKVSWSSSNKSVATVDETGKVIAAGVGSAKITVTTEDGGKTASCSVSVSSISVTGVSLNKTSLSLTIGSTEQLIATVAPSNATNQNVTWSSSNSSVATVDSNGNVSAIKVGTAIITATTEDGGKKATCSVAVNELPKATSLALSGADFLYSARVGNEYSISVDVKPVDANVALEWSVSDESLAEIIGEGRSIRLRAKDYGPSTIMVRDKISGLTASEQMVAGLVDFYWTENTGKTYNGCPLVEIEVGEERQLSCYYEPEYATRVFRSDTDGFWYYEPIGDNTEISNIPLNHPSFFSIDENGTITGKKEGLTRIHVRSPRIYNNAQDLFVRVVKKTIPVTGVSLNETSITLVEGDSHNLYATISPSNATDKSVTWSSSNTSVATVSSSGVVSAKAAGTATIMVTTNDGGKKAACSVSVSAVTVSVTGVSLNKASLSMTVGDTQTLIATVTPSNATDKSVTWSSSNTSIATVSSSGVVAAKAAGSATITVTTADGGKTAICPVTVNAQTISVTSVSLDCGSLSMGVGITKTLVATVTPFNATDKSVSWTSSNTTVATVSSSGMVTAKAAGSATITVTTNDGGKMATCSVSVLDPVELGAVSIKSITFSRAVVSCPISYGHNMVLEKGVCVSTKPSLTPSDNEGIFLAATDEEMLSLVIDGLSQGTTYYVIAFVTTSSDYGRTGSSSTSYTKPVSFTTLTAPNYVVPGLFSVSSSKKVYLASGNLMYKESDEKYHIFQHQYDILGKLASNGTFDMLNWGGFVGFSSIVEQTNGTWRLMSIQESTYLISERPNASKLKVTVVVNEVTGLMLLPDDWVCPSSISMPANNDTISLATWAKLEEAGAVFIPCAGIYNPVYKTIDNVGIKGSYSTSSKYSNSYYMISIPEGTSGLNNYGIGCARPVIDY
jgi:uncharacterized protein YjdB